MATLPEDVEQHCISMAPFSAFRPGLDKPTSAHRLQPRFQNLSEPAYGALYWFAIPFGVIIFLFLTFYTCANIRYWHDDQIEPPSWKPVVLLSKYLAHRTQKFFKSIRRRISELGLKAIRGKPKLIHKRFVISSEETIEAPSRAHLRIEETTHRDSYISAYDLKGEIIRRAQRKKEGESSTSENAVLARHSDHFTDDYTEDLNFEIGSDTSSPRSSTECAEVYLYGGIRLAQIPPIQSPKPALTTLEEW